MVNVPNVPGVPAVIRTGIQAAVSLLINDGFGIGNGFAQAQWGIYRGGAPIVVCDNVVSFEYRQEWALADYPIERGGFETYDKVQLPYDARFRFTAGGSEANRQALLSSIAAVAGDLNFYDVVTPEAVYVNVNISHYDYTRTATNGVGLLTVDVWALEIRQTAATIMSNTKEPTSAGTVNGGSVQPSLADSGELALKRRINGGHAVE